MKRFMDILRDSLLVIAVICLIVASLCLFLRIKPAVVTSGSMEPTIHTGSLAFVDTKDTDVIPGDIIAFETSGNYVTHRVVQVKEDGYVTKGDANKTEDPWIVKPDSVLGHTITSVPYLGYIVEYMAHGSGKYIALAVIAVLFLSTLLEDRREETRYGKHYKEIK